MKQIPLISVFIFLIGCSGDSSQDKPIDSQAVWDSMQAAIAVDQPFTNDDSAARSSDTLAVNTVAAIDPEYDAFFQVWFTTSYCGGARPTDEIVAQNAKERLLTTSQVKLKNHFTGKEYILKTSPDGEARAKMEQGKYDVYLTSDINKNLGTGFDEKCSLWLSQQLMTIKVDSSGEMNKILIHFVCNPCDEDMKKRP